MNKLALFAIAAVTVAGAANADVYVHGKTAGGNGYAKGLNGDFSYWGGYNGANASGAKRAYNWDGKSDIVSFSAVAGDFNAKLPSKSIIRCHSAGCLLTARAIQLYGIGKFSRVVAGASAEGGSELASISGAILDFDALNNALRPNSARSFSHATGATTHHGAGSKSEGTDSVMGFIGSPLTAARLPGEDDGAVAYHSALGKANTGTWCDSDSVWYNPASYGCVAWNKGTQYSGHLAREKGYVGHSPARAFATRGW